MSVESFDVAVIGTGPGGSVASALLADSGCSVVAIEKDAFPRFHIGESLTGTAGEIIRKLGLADQMAANDFPDKPGVNVIGKDARNEFFVPVLNPTWQVRRSTFDAMLRDTSRERGAVHRRGRVTRVLRRGDAVTGLSYLGEGETSETEIRARVVIDASGQSVLLSQQGIAGPRKIDHFSRQIAFFAYYEGVERDPGRFSANTSIFYSEVHNWSWVIPISSTVDSVGIVIPQDVHRQLGKPSPEAAMEYGIANINPELRSRMRNARRVEPVRACRDYSYRVDPFVGDGWLCVGDSHRFLDPIFSFGVSFSMSEAERAAGAILEALETGDRLAPFEAFAHWSDTGQGVAADLIRYFWKYPVFFGYQMQNTEIRDEVIRLFGGQCFKPDGMKTPKRFREALEKDDDSPQPIRDLRAPVPRELTAAASA